MKLMHLGDLHFGKIVNEFRMIDDQRYILEKLLGIVDERGIDVVMIAGDVYDKNVPSEDAVNLFDFFLAELAGRNVKVLVISGNHDSDDRLHFGSKLFEARGVYITGKYDGVIPKVTLTDEYGEVDFYSLPFVKASQVAHFHPELDTDTYDKAVRAAISTCDIDESRRNVILAHQFVTVGSADPMLSGSEIIREDTVGTVEKVGASAFDQFDYVALGHIHRPQKVGREEVRYSGSPLKYSLSEINNNKSVPVITLRNKGECDIELIELKPLRDMRHIKGTIEQLLNPLNVTDTDDYIYVTLTDENTVPDAMGRIHQVYPYAMKLDYDNKHSRELRNMDFNDYAESKTFEELIGDFYKDMYGDDPEDAEWEILKEAAREAGII